MKGGRALGDQGVFWWSEVGPEGRLEGWKQKVARGEVG